MVSIKLISIVVSIAVFVENADAGKCVYTYRVQYGIFNLLIYTNYHDVLNNHMTSEVAPDLDEITAPPTQI